MFGNSAFSEAAFGEDSSAQQAAVVSPGAGALVFTGLAPTLMQMSGLFPTSASLTISGPSPSIGQGRSVSPSSGLLNIFGYVPSAGNGQSIQPQLAAVMVWGNAPSISQGNEAQLKPVSIVQFRIDFPEFSDPVKYTDAQIRVQLVSGSMVLSELLWGDMWPYAIELRAAHYLTVRSRNASTIAGGGAGGAVSGFMKSKQVDKVSASYDYGATTYEGAGFWNTSSYGIEFYQLLMLFGAGVVQL